MAQQKKKTGTASPELELKRRLDALLDEDWKADEAVAAAQQLRTEELEPQASAAKRHPPKKSAAMTLIHDLVYILAAVVLIFTFFVRMSRVEGDSMKPTLVEHDRMLLLSGMWYGNPTRGDIVVARVPEFSSDPIVKRVIAVEGDTVNIDFERGIVYVNDVPLEEDYINELTYRKFTENGVEFPMTIEKNHVFLLGDNRNDSYDSRYGKIGQVDRRCVLGKVIAIVLPGQDPVTKKRDFSRFGFVQ